MKKIKKIAIIGSGFSGLSAAAYLSKLGHEVDVYEKNKTIGGRARQIEQDGFTFDMGPSWYWMPEVFERFYNDFGYTTSDFYELERLSPAFNMVFDKGDEMLVPDDYADLKALFEKIEKGSADQLDKFMKDAKLKYDISFADLIEKPGLKITEYINLSTIKNSVNLKLFSSYQKLVYAHFKNEKLRSLMEFPVLFLGAMPKDTPALYSLMNYAGLKLGTHYPMGGFFSVIKAMEKIALNQGVNFHINTPIEKINVVNNTVVSLKSKLGDIKYDGIVGSADYQHIESKLLDKEHRNYKLNYWSKKTFAPSSLIFYLGIDKKIANIHHHTLFFDEDYNQHAREIYQQKAWPDKPLFYVCTPSKTDANVAPKGCENVFILMPLATGIQDTEEIREKYFQKIIKRLESHLDQNITHHIVVKKSYCINDFKNDYNAYGGNAYGLANTLAQTAILKPKIINKKINNLVYTGQLTVPGPGFPPSLISGKISANLLNKQLKSA